VNVHWLVAPEVGLEVGLEVALAVALEGALVTSWSPPFFEPFGVCSDCPEIATV
jgi:hypothetical protein